MQYGLVCKPETFLYDEDLTSRTDELLYGWAVEIHGEREGFLLVETHYGYTGFLRADDVILVSGNALQARERDKRTKVVLRRFMDVLSEPSVHGEILATLGRGSLIEVTKERDDGYSEVNLLDGEVGFISSTAWMDRADTDAYFWAGDRENFFLQLAAERRRQVPEQVLRSRAVAMAKLYEGSQYRWSGKSAHGTDCSGLTFMSWFLCGILIYRDASIESRWPVRDIALEQILPGDLLYFPGHIAMYIGGGKYVHSTGYRANFGYAVNSLKPEDPDYREDLAHEILHAGSIFVRPQ